tara:strand:+ start:3565 stop:4410 length:846 start_codon:yes stop_codon:yes gene_type:complete
MNFNNYEKRLWFCSNSYKVEKNVVLTAVEIYKDSANSLLAIKRNKFLGIYKSLEELNEIMLEDNYINIEKIVSNSENKSIKEIGLEIIKICRSINKIELEFVSENFNSKPIYNIDNLRKQKLNNIYYKTRQVFLEFIKNCNVKEEEIMNNESDSSDDRYITVDLSNWNQKEKEVLFTDCLKGIYYYHVEHSQKKSFDFGTYRTIHKALDGYNKVEIYKESIKWFNSYIKEKLIENNYDFPDLDYQNNSNYKYSSRDIQDQVNDFYKNDEQMGEWWNSKQRN